MERSESATALVCAFTVLEVLGLAIIGATSGDFWFSTFVEAPVQKVAGNEIYSYVMDNSAFHWLLKGIFVGLGIRWISSIDFKPLCSSGLLLRIYAGDGKSGVQKGDRGLESGAGFTASLLEVDC
jgi:hypothetical protein